MRGVALPRVYAITGEVDTPTDAEKAAQSVAYMLRLRYLSAPGLSEKTHEALSVIGTETYSDYALAEGIGLHEEWLIIRDPKEIPDLLYSETVRVPRFSSLRAFLFACRLKLRHTLRQWGMLAVLVALLVPGYAIRAQAPLPAATAVVANDTATYVAALVPAAQHFYAALDAASQQYPAQAGLFADAKALVKTDVDHITASHASGDDTGVAMGTLSLLSAERGFEESGLELAAYPAVAEAWHDFSVLTFTYTKQLAQ